MTKKAPNDQRFEVCSCSVSPHVPPLAGNLNHITLAFDPVDYSTPPVAFTGSRFAFCVSAAPLDGLSPGTDHPPRLST